MKRQAILRGLIIVVCACILIGCGTRQTKGPEENDMHIAEPYQNDRSDTEDQPLNEEEEEKNAALPETEKKNDTTADNVTGKVDADSLYASAVMIGSVVDFSDSGCTVSPAVTEDDGKTGVIAAPGYESEDTNVKVTYQEDCVVQMATIYTSTGMAELEQASAADIKKQSSIIIYGNFEDTSHVSAAKIFICHRTV